MAIKLENANRPKFVMQEARERSGYVSGRVLGKRDRTCRSLTVIACVSRLINIENEMMRIPAISLGCEAVRVVIVGSFAFSPTVRERTLKNEPRMCWGFD